MKKSDEDNSNGKMRKKAEEILKTRTTKSDYSLTESDALKLIHALEVHQIELELQNEELSLAKNELASLSNKYTDLYDFAPNGYFTLSKEGKILESNLNGAEMLGKTKSELANSQFGFYVEKKSIDDFTQFLQKVFTSLAQVNIEIVLLLNKNKNRTIYLTGIANENRDECFVSAVDITEKKLAEESLKLSEKRFEDLVKLLPEAVFEIDKNLTLTYVNQQAMDLFGYTQTDFTNGLNALEMLVPEEREKAKNIFAKRLKGEEPGTIEYRALKKDGSTFPILFHARSIVENGKLLGARGVFIDISELKNAEHELAKSEKKFKNIFNNSVVGKSITELDGNLKVNKAFSEIVGYSRKELNHKKWHEFTHTDDVEKNQEIVESILSGKIKTARWEKRYIHKKGHIVWVDISTTLQRDDEGQPQFLITSVADITERKQAEKELREFKDLFSLFMQHSPVYTFIKEISDTKCWIIQASDNYKDMVGLSGSEMIGKTMEELFPAEFAENITADDLAAVKEGKVVQVDENFNNRNYTTIKFPLVMENRKLLAGYTIDITDRKKAEKEIVEAKEKAEENEEKMRLAEENLKNTFHISPSIIAKANLNTGFYVEANQAVTRILGYSVEEFISTPIKEMVLPDDFNNTKDVILEQQKGKDVKSFENRFLCKDGTIKWISWNASPADDKGIVIGVGSDITQQKLDEIELIKAKEKAEENEREMKKAQKTAKVGSWVWSIPDNKLWWSDEMYSIFDIDKETFTGELDKVIEKAIHPEDRKKVELSNLSVINENKPIPVEYRILLKDGSVRYVLGVADEIVKDEKGKSKLLTGIVKDITDYKLIQNELVAAKEKAEESDRLKSAFLANMSHEIRTPMNGIFGFTDLLKEPGLTGEQQEKFIEIIQKSGNRMLNTVNDIVEISRIEAGEMKVNSNAVNMNKHLLTLTNFFKLEAEKKGLELIVEENVHEEQCSIITDKSKLSSIISNLLKNAIKYTEKGFIKIGCRKNEKFLEFNVEDSGIGIPADRIDAVFNRFEQADIKDTRVYEGSGLGLAIAKSYVEMLGGKIWVDSEENRGSVFYFTIPHISTSPDISELKKKPTIRSVEKIKNIEKILIAEDEDEVYIYLSLILNKHTDEIIRAKNGNDTVELARSNPDIQLILMDIRMPGLDGYQATKKIREFNKDVVIIAQTAYALQGDREKALAAGCNDYISKPIDRKLLENMILKYFA